jgi:hypothetical protein
MPIDTPPPPPRIERPAANVPQGQAPIADRREEFACKTPQTMEDEASARAFIEGKVEMIRRDPRMTEAEKAAAIEDLKSRR